MAMYHAGHPDGNYQMANRVQAFDPPRAISWEPGQDTGDGSLRFGGWVWAYDLAPAEPSGTRVTLSYDWSAVPAPSASTSDSPPFPPDHLGNSLARLFNVRSWFGPRPAAARMGDPNGAGLSISGDGGLRPGREPATCQP
jgi:hypothetical protein